MMIEWVGCTRKMLSLVAVGCIAVGMPMLAQTATATPSRDQALGAAAPSFEVASVRLVSGEHGSTSISPAGSARFTARNASMKVLIEYAFGVDDKQISGENLGWMDSELYDVEAKPEGDVILNYEQMKPLLQDLLARRFKLAFHREQKDFRGFGLVVAKNGSKLQASKEPSSGIYILRDGLRGRGIPMAILASMLARPVGRPVVDKTGITGNYDIKLKFAPEGSTDSQLPSIFTALQEQLGLKLKPQKVPVEMLVIDHLGKVPSEN
jgi:uncharacterized protein (TIGR03435 family)